jgi:hypothetical protein
MSEAIFRSAVNLAQFKSDDYVASPGLGEVALFQRNDFQSLLAIQLSNGEKLSVLFSSIYDVRYRSSKKIVFINFYHNNRICSFSLQFPDQTNFDHFLDEITRLNFEASNKQKATGDDLFEINQIKASCSLDRTIIPERNDEPFFVQENIHLTSKQDTGKNKLLTTAPRHHSSLVIRHYKDHSDLGLFDLNPECKFKQSVEKIGISNQHLDVSDMMLHNGEQNLLLLDTKDQNQIFDFDLNRGQIINSFQSSKNGVGYPVKKLIPLKADKEQSPFLAISDRDTLLFDPREGRSISNKSEYKTKNNFTSGATTSNGKVAIGSQNGIIRLYSGPCLTRANTNMYVNAGNDPITFIDISPDERWILTTSPKSVAVFSVDSSSNPGKVGFDYRMGKEKQPVCLLTLQPRHQQQLANFFGGILPDFSSAKFDIKGGKIYSIIAGIGSALISWDFQRIERGAEPVYQIAFIDDGTVNDEHPYSLSDDLIYISDNNVASVQRKRGRK